MSVRIDPAAEREWQMATVELCQTGEFWDVSTWADACRIRLRLRYYGHEYLTECRCEVREASGDWVLLERFTYPIWELMKEVAIDVTLFPEFGTELFAGLMRHWHEHWWDVEIEPLPVQYLAGGPVVFPLLMDDPETILWAGPEAVPMRARQPVVTWSRGL